jgi:hypothetical protein
MTGILRTTALAAALGLATGATAQTLTVTGRVVDDQTGQPLAAASVFCQNTTIGTATAADGSFRLLLPAGGYDVVVSFSGYETSSSRVGRGGEAAETLDVRLRTRDRSLTEVSVVATTEVREGWKRYGSLFRDQFLGMTEGTDSCTIENADSLRFFYSRRRDRLKVIAREPLRIRNAALGYHIRYELDSFVHDFGTGHTEYAGYAFFEEMDGEEDQKAAWAERRREAYFGSMLHFMRSYYDSTLAGDGFRIERVDPATGKSGIVYNPYDSAFFVAFDDGESMLVANGRLRVTYAREKPDPSYLRAKKMPENTPVQISILEFPEAVIIQQNGYYFDQKDILALGYWSWEKMGVLLPYDYEPD